ncbi:RNA polymerase sigma-I factor [Clostridium malenominatum]|uniref:RNA polymerase sigma factor SigI n=1 Tax=Clostridium malenominatum TaxID=1539 RepID=A0ABN1J1Y6_9CLOT
MNLNEHLKGNRSDFIENNKGFIYSTAYRVCGRKLSWENDDELSIAMIAFDKACNTYKEERGNFFSYAKVLIKNSLINYFKAASKKYSLVFNDECDLEEINLKQSVSNYEISMENEARAEEINLLNNELSQYNIAFRDLVENSPSHSDTKNNLLNVAFQCAKESIIMDYIYKNKMLPIKEICILAGVKRKFLEKWRRYLIAVILILSNNEYTYLKSYLDIKVGDSNDN